MPNVKKIGWLLAIILWCSFVGKADGNNGNLLRPVSFEHLYIDDFYWYFQFRSQRVNTLPVIWNRLAANGLLDGKYMNKDLEDADLYHLLETMSYIYVVEPDSLQRGRLDSLAALVPKGFSDQTETTWLKHARKESHPLYYQMAAFYRAAFAYTRAGGQKPLLHWALQHAERLSSALLQKSDKIKERDLHPNMVLALGDFYLLTQNDIFLKAAALMQKQMDGKNWGQEQGLYYAAQAWLAGLTGDRKVLEENHACWKEAVNRTMRITGGFSVHPEAVPETRFALLETMANMEWCIRLYAVTQDARCMELFERAMYNELRAGISFHGGYMARNLEMDEQKELVRDSISQVPLNQAISLIRNLAVLPDYYYATQNDTTIYINQYFRGEVTVKTQKLNMKLSTMSSMPWAGGFYMDIIADTPQNCTFYLRVPSWMTDDCLEGMGRYRYLPQSKQMSLLINGVNKPIRVENGFIRISGTWKKDDRIVFTFFSAVRTVLPKDTTEQVVPSLAYQRAPFVYCQEELNPILQQQRACKVLLKESAPTRFALGLAGGVQIIEGRLYDLKSDSLQGKPLLLTPYFARGQRGSANTKIWFPYFTKDKRK